MCLMRRRFRLLLSAGSTLVGLPTRESLSASFQAFFPNLSAIPQTKVAAVAGQGCDRRCCREFAKAMKFTMSFRNGAEPVL